MPSAIQDILEEYVTRLRRIPDLVAALDGEASRIFAYHEERNKDPQLTQIILRWPAPFLMGYLGNSAVVNRASRESFGYEIIFAGRFSSETQWLDAFEAFCHGIPTGTTNKLRYQAVSPRVYPMSAPQFRRIAVAVSDTADVVYFEISFTVALRGD